MKFSGSLRNAKLTQTLHKQSHDKGLSFPRKRESRFVLKHWMPARAGMTELNTWLSPEKLPETHSKLFFERVSWKLLLAFMQHNG
jgi:hypothetical protein